MSNWDRFDRKIDNKFLNEIETDNLSNDNFEELPLGKYEVSLESMELKESKKGDPMVATVFKVVQGDYKGRLIFKNTVIYRGDEHDKLRIQNELRFLKSLDTNEDIFFKNFSQFAMLIEVVFKSVKEAKLEYLLEITERKNFRYYTIKEVFETDEVSQPYATDTLPF